MPVLGLGRAETDEAVDVGGTDCFLINSIGARAVLGRGSAICRATLVAGVEMALTLTIDAAPIPLLLGEEVGPTESLTWVEGTIAVDLITRFRAGAALEPNVRWTGAMMGAERAVGPEPGRGKPAFREG